MMTLYNFPPLDRHYPLGVRAAGFVMAALFMGPPTASTAIGQVFEPPRAVSGSLTDSDPSLATDGNGHWVLTWQSRNTLGGTIGLDFDILVVRSADNGQTWTDLAPLNAEARTDSVDDIEPQVATDRHGDWVVVWKSPSYVIAWSSDNGASWTEPVPLGIAGSSLRFAADGAGTWVVVWESAGIFASRSEDALHSLSSPVQLDSHSGTNQGPQLAGDGKGGWIVVWQSNADFDGLLGSDYDILQVRSPDDGVTWIGPVPLNGDADSDVADDDNPHPAVSAGKDWVASWRSAKDGTHVRVARSSDVGVTWSAPVRLDQILVPQWAPFTSIQQPLVRTDGIGHWSVFFSGKSVPGDARLRDLDIWANWSDDNGLSWSFASAVNMNFIGDQGDDSNLDVATGAGAWIAVWDSNDTLGGTVGSDKDIFMALGSICGDGLEAGSEQCDESGESVACDADCTLAVCGDATTNTTAGETCDDGNLIDGDGCDSNCTPTGCGNGIPTGDEQCDDGNIWMC